MSLPATPNPCPTLKEGLALGAADHRGFVNVWNWMCGIMRRAKDYLCLGINGRTGDVNIIAGDGVNVTAEGQTIMISMGTGKNTDNDGGSTGGSGGGRGGGAGGSGGGTGGSGGGRGDGAGGSGGDGWTSAARPSVPSGEDSTQCNDWAEDGGGNGFSLSDDSNLGDNCAELNGW